MTHLSLFSGIGGIDLAAEWAGFSTVAFVERDKFCQKVLAKHWPNTPIYDDITTFDGTRFRGVDLVSGGFPCQPHSLAGKRKASSDERDLWGEMRRVVGEARPEWVVAENVPGLFSSESGRFFGRVISDLAEMGYRVGWSSYGASDVGSNHRRRRVFIVAYSESNLRGTPRNDGPEPFVREVAVGYSDSERCKELAYRIAERTGYVDGGIVADAESSGRDVSSTALSAEHQRHKQIRGPHLGGDVADTRALTDAQTDSTTIAIGRGRQPRDDASRRYWGCDWRTWDVKPVIRRGDDGTTHRVDRLRALGNAVVPQQVYPVLKAIAEAL